LEEFYFKNNQDGIISTESQNVLETFSGVQNVPHLKIIDLSNNAFAGQLSASYEGAVETVETLNLAYNNLSINMICKIFPGLKNLNISHGFSTKFATNIISNCSSLEIVDLSDNSFNNNIIENLDNISFEGTDNIRKFILSNNYLRWLDKKFLDKVYALPNMSLDLSSIIFSCICESHPQLFIKWLQVNGEKNKLLGYDSYECEGLNGNTLIKDISNVQRFFSICNGGFHFLTFFSTLGSIAIIAALLFIYLKRWRLKYYMFCFKQYIKNICSTNPEKITWKYDAFVSYCAEDRFWVHDMFMKILEQNYGFHLCIH
jgi:hypothetical protein